MPYTRPNRPSYYTDLRLERGWWKCVALPCQRTREGERLARKVESMWDTLAKDHRAWDVLGAVKAGRWSIGHLWDLWRATRGDVVAIRQRLNDVELSRYRDAFLVMYDKQVRNQDSRDRMRRHLRALFGITVDDDGRESPPASPLLASSATPDELTTRLYGYGAGAASANTLRVVHANWSVFLDYARTVKHALASDPMDAVARPPRVKRPPAFYELDVIERIVDWQPTAKRRALFALIYGAALEPSLAVALMRSDLWPIPDKRGRVVALDVRAAGTKAHTRDRVIRLDDWAFARVWPFVKDMLPAVRVFDETNRWTASDWHRGTVGAGERGFANQHGIAAAHDGLQLATRLPLYNARHAYAARHLRAGEPVELVQRVLGHATAKLTLDTYGMFLPGAADRDHWQKQVAKAERRRRQAQ